MPFSTAYFGGQYFNRDATLVYLVSMLLPALAYTPFQQIIRVTGSQSDAAQRYHRQTARKGIAATVIHLAGFPMAFVAPWLGIACAGLLAVLWFLPRSPVDRLFADD